MKKVPHLLLQDEVWCPDLRATLALEWEPEPKGDSRRWVQDRGTIPYRQFIDEAVVGSLHQPHKFLPAGGKVAETQGDAAPIAAYTAVLAIGAWQSHSSHPKSTPRVSITTREYLCHKAK